jgi:hypothetical protein
LLYPLGTLLFSIGKGMRSLKIAVGTAPVVILCEMIGLRYGPLGIAAGHSVATALLVLPVIFWAAHKTPVTAGDMLMGDFTVPLVQSHCGRHSFGLLKFPSTAEFTPPAAHSGKYFIIRCPFYHLTFCDAEDGDLSPMLRDAGLWPILSRWRRIATVPTQVRD